MNYWRGAKSVGRFESSFFDPLEWRPEYPNPAFDNMQPEDAFWAARLVSRFSDEAIRAVVVLRPGCEATDEEIIAFCREHLTHFKCPSSVEFIDALPKGGTGKIQKNRLREKFWQGQEKRIN